MRTRWHCAAGILEMVFAVAFTACGGPTQSVTVGVTAPGDIVYHGHKLRWVRSHPDIQTQHPLLVRGSDGTAQLPSGVQRLPDRAVIQVSETASTSASPIDSMSIDELAEALRPMVLVNGQEYVGADPDYETAQALKNGTVKGAKGEPSAPAVTLAAAVTKAAGLIPKTSDNRYPVLESSGPPAQQAAVVTYDGTNTQFLNEGSATIIGPHTAVTAAHVMYNNTNGYWNEWAEGFADPGTSEPGPLGYFNQHGCMGTTFYTAFKTEGNSGTWDFAVLDFSGCTGSDNPANAVGYMGYWWGWASSASMPGYAFVDVWGSPDPAAHCTWPEECGEGGWYTDMTSVFVDSNNLFAGEGQSGTSWMYFDGDSNAYHVGTHIQVAYSGSTFQFSRGRLFDGDFYSLCHNFSDSTRFP